ncbi:hypothetical protein CDD81_4432 [Ophiocordyceps australis]|uniref:Meiotically up-regulated protein Msb1/Mug8 domain-containing protein n=1 Tax=Ophiocordyceps australis TaxID=1399860 RepID=A0A2C5YE89_9HYPO|nr:hypothetical protein CDD81_4432 [Ophiocordyceps australis]
MPGLFSRLKGRDGVRSKKKKNAAAAAASLPQKPTWDDAYARTTVEADEIHELLHCCTAELKARALDLPFFMLPFRPTSDPSAVRTFIRQFFSQKLSLRGEALLQEIRMTEPMVIAGVTKWCWSRLSGGVVGWDAYELFKVGEYDSNQARDSFKTFIPISVDNGAKQRIIFDFFDLIAAVAAHGKSNGFGGLQLSRMAAWWAFEHKDTGNGFDGGYRAWLSAADATSHLFFAYLRSLSPEHHLTGISMLPRSLEKLLRETDYPPPRSAEMMSSTNKLAMIVDAVSPTPFSLLRRAGHFQYRDSDRGLQEFSEHDDPVQALSEECYRVLKAISAANQSQVSNAKHSTGLREASWSRFEDIGFSSALDDDEELDGIQPTHTTMRGLRSTPASGNNNMARPTTPSWADFLSSGFVDEGAQRPNLLLPPDKVLPPIESQVRHSSSQSHRPRLESDRDLEPGELASITKFELDEAFWWVWMSSLAPDETPDRKSAFGRCAVIETRISSARWIVVEEIVAGAAPEPAAGAYIAEKKRFFSWTKRGKNMTRRKSTGKDALVRGDKALSEENGSNGSGPKTTMGADTHARIQAKAAQLRAMKDNEQQAAAAAAASQRRGRTDAELMSEKTNSVFTLQPIIAGEASSAMKWVKKYDKGTIKDVYMANSNAGRGVVVTSDMLDFPTPATEADISVDSSVGRVTPEVPSKTPSPGPHVSIIAAARPSVQSPEPESVHEDSQAPVPSTPEVSTNDTRRSEAADGSSTPTHDQKLVKHGTIVPDVAQHEGTNAKGRMEGAKLHKAPAGKERPGALRKFFGRKNRSSKVPDNASSDVNGMLLKEQPTVVTEPIVQQTPTPAPTPPPMQEVQEVVHQVPQEPMDQPVEELDEQYYETPEPAAMPTPEPDTPQTGEQADVEPDYKASEELSRVDTQDAAEATREFSRFDQGPLTDQPAFAPQAEEETRAISPPIARPAARSNRPKAAPEKVREGLSHAASPGVQDRWAQIRKNAAQRAATRQKEDRPRGLGAKTGEGEDDLGDDTIESRVARIKARVAELTGNMEEGGDSRQALPSRR